MKSFTMQMTVYAANLPAALNLKSVVWERLRELQDHLCTPGINSGGGIVLKRTDITEADPHVLRGTASMETLAEKGD